MYITGTHLSINMCTVLRNR